MRYKKELASLQEYIANFDPQEFTSSAEFVRSWLPSSERLAEIQKLKARFKRNRQLAETFHSLLNVSRYEEIISQDQVDALLEGWTPPND